MKLLYIISLLYLWFAFVACDPYHSRPCDAFYYDCKRWQVEKFDSLEFVSSHQKSLLFTLVDSNSSLPHEGGLLGGSCCKNDPAMVTCFMWAQFDYECKDLDINLRIEFNQHEGFQQAIDEQAIYYIIYAKLKKDSFYQYLTFFNIGPDLKVVAPRQTIYDSLMLNNKVYYNVLETVKDTSISKLEKNYSFLKLRIAKEKGLFYLMDSDQNEYFLKE